MIHQGNIIMENPYKIPESELSDPKNEIIEIKEVTFRRRMLLPLWVKFFIWFFMIWGGIVFLLVGVGLIMGNYIQLSLYGIECDDIFTFSGIIISALYLIKFITAIGLWLEKNWAVELSIVDAILGILVCVISTIITFAGATKYSGAGVSIFIFRFEIIVLFLYLMKMVKVRERWNELEVLDERS